VTGCEFPRLQLRGSAGFSPASLLNEDARTKEVEKERKATSPDSEADLLNQNLKEVAL
jgi:hypothetical protein